MKTIKYIIVSVTAYVINVVHTSSADLNILVEIIKKMLAENLMLSRQTDEK